MNTTFTPKRLIRRLARLLLIIAIALAVALGLIAVALVATPQGRAAARAVGFVAQVLPAVPVKPATWFADAPTRQDIRYPLSDGRGGGVADMYLPAGEGKRSAMLLFLGVNPAGRDDERVVNLAEALARSGVVVMVPWSEAMTQKKVEAAEVDNLVRAFEYLAAHEAVDGDRLGMAGFCVGASFALAAAQDERVSERVSVFNSFGGYYDARDLMAAVIARQRFYEDDVRAWQPADLSVEVVRRHLIDTLPYEDERQLLWQALAAGSDAPAGLPGGLSAEAQAVYALLTAAPDLETARRLLDRLPPDALDTLRRISPSANIDRLRAKLLVMHDREDRLVPSEESRRLVDAAPGGADVHYTEFSFFNHLDPTRPVGRIEFAREAGKLFLHIYRIMRELP